MKQFNKALLSLMLLLLCVGEVNATVYYWRAPALNNADLSWTSLSNWSITPGSNTVPSALPGINDDVVFDASSPANSCVINADVIINSLTVNWKNNGTISLNNAQLAIVNNYNQSMGNFVGTYPGSAIREIKIGGNFNLTGGTFTSTASKLYVEGTSFNVTGGTFNHNNGTVYLFNKNVNKTINGNPVFYELILSSAGVPSPYNSTPQSIPHALNIASFITVKANLTLEGGARLRIDGGKIYAEKIIRDNNTGTGGGGDGTIVLTGTGSQSIIGTSNVPGTALGALCNIEVAKPSGNLTIGRWIFLTGNFITNVGNTQVFGSGAGLCLIDKNDPSGVPYSSFKPNIIQNFQTIMPDLHIKNVQPFSLNIKGTPANQNKIFLFNLNITGSAQLNMDGDVFAVRDYVNVTNTAPVGGGTATISILGTDISGTPNGTVPLCNVLFESTSNNVNINNIVTIGGNLSFNDYPANAGTATPYRLNKNAGAGVLKVLGDLNYNAVNVLKLMGGTATIELAGGTNTSVNGYSTASPNSAGVLPNIVINKSAAAVTLKENLPVQGNFIVQNGKLGADKTSKLWLFAEGSTNYTLNTGAPGNELNRLRILNQVATNGLAGKIILGSNITLAENLIIMGNRTDPTGASTPEGMLDAGTKSIFVGRDWINDGTFISGTSTVHFQGMNTHSLDKSNGTEVFYNLIMAGAVPTASLTYSSAVQVNNLLTLSMGPITTDNSSLFTFNAGASSTGASNDSYIDAQVQKIGNSAFVFPLGSITLSSNNYHPLKITAPTLATDAFTAQYFAQNQTLSANKSGLLDNLSACEYWLLQRNNGTSDVQACAAWVNANTCSADYTSYTGDIALAYYNNSVSNWNYLGTYNAVLPIGTGNLTAYQSIPIVPFATGNAPTTYLTFGKSYGDCGVLRKKPDGGYFSITNKVLKFKYDEEYTDTDALLNFKIYDRAQKIIFSSSDVPPGQAASVVSSAFGDNRYSINFANYTTAPFIQDEFYLLEVCNEKKEKFYLRFKYQ